MSANTDRRFSITYGSLIYYIGDSTARQTLTLNLTPYTAQFALSSNALDFSLNQATNQLYQAQLLSDNNRIATTSTGTLTISQASTAYRIEADGQLYLANQSTPLWDFGQNKRYYFDSDKVRARMTLNQTIEF